MEKINVILVPLYDELGLQKHLILEDIKNRWDVLLGSPLNIHTYPHDLRDGELIINVDSTLWLQQLKYMQSIILRNLSSYPVKSIKLRIGKIKGRRQETNFAGNFSKQNITSKMNYDAEWLNNALQNIKDSDMKDQIKRAVITSLFCKL